MPPLPHIDTQMTMKIAITVVTLAVLLASWLRARRRTLTHWQLPSAPNPWHVTPSPRPPAAAEVPRRAQPTAELSRLESLLRRTILDPGARDRLVADAMQRTGGNRESAIRRVLEDLDKDNGHW